MCMYQTWPVDALRRHRNMDGVSLVCSSMVRIYALCLKFTVQETIAVGLHVLVHCLASFEP